MGPRPSRYSSSSLIAEWEVVDNEVMIRAKNYRISLQLTWEKIKFHNIISDIQKYYLALDLQTLMKGSDYSRIQKLFQDAYDTGSIKPVVKAYTSGTNLYKLINNDLANMVSTNNLRDIGMSLDAPQDRSYWEGSLDIACLLVNHPDLDYYKITEEIKVYRGMTVPENVLVNYSEGTRLMNKTFLSTSKTVEAAEFFVGTRPGVVGCLCIYTLLPSERRTAIDIETCSAFPEEHEVLILPYATFEIQSVKREPYKDHPMICMIELRECHNFDD